MVKPQQSNSHKNWELVTVTDRQWIVHCAHCARTVRKNDDEKRQYLKPNRISLQKQNHTERESDKIDEKITVSPKKSQIEQQLSSKLRSRSLHDLIIPGEDKKNGTRTRKTRK